MRLHDISPHDLQRLRVVVKQVLRRLGVPAGQITDREADKYIESVAPLTAEKMLKRVVDARLGS